MNESSKLESPHGSPGSCSILNLFEGFAISISAFGYDFLKIVERKHFYII